ncbi:BAR superfamily protein [Blumeria hordei DH14]|uniref:BAR superfamily protein n=1 Tax=Blumeria graminis f. sp. hordei (strain DH14) TaxID=546991 RepID=N1J907_BLUG1|nr:BAR superfamily protein [Blumeria hordei DH14]
MEALTRQEYPAMLDRLHPGTAVIKLNERVKKIGKVNAEVADWLQERRKVESIYAASLRKLARRPLQDVGNDMGVFDSPWRQIMAATDDIARFHSDFAECIDKDIEQPLRNFTTTNSEMSGITTMQGNILSLSKELEEAQDKIEKLNRRGTKVNVHKADLASNRLQAAIQQWEAQAPFVFETLQALDERRLNHLRDVLTQYQTHEADINERIRKSVESTLKFLLDVDTEIEIKNWSQAGAPGKSLLKSNSSGGANSSAVPPQTASSFHGDNQSENSLPNKGESGEKKKLQRIGTIFTRRRQSVHSVFRSSSPVSKNGFQSFGRVSSSRGGRSIPSPRASSTHLRETDGRLCSLPESPPSASLTHENNGNTLHAIDLPQRKSSLPAPSGTGHIESTEVPETEPTNGLSPSHTAEIQVDDEGFTIPPPQNDPISQAEQEIAQSEQPQFKLNIRKDPILEQDSDAEAALSNVTNTLRSAQISTPSRKSGTFRGRRDIRNTVLLSTGESLGITPEYPERTSFESTPSVPATLPLASTGTTPSKPISSGSFSSEPISTVPIPPDLSSLTTSPLNSLNQTIALSNLSLGEQSAIAGSDSISIRSGHSLTNKTSLQHPEINSSGLSCSIIETLAISFDGEEIQTKFMTGEISLIYNPVAEVESTTIPTHEKIKITNYSRIKAIKSNRMVVDPVFPENSDQYTVNLPSVTSKAAVAFSYQVNTSEPEMTPAPLLIKRTWKNQGDKLGLIIEYSLNPEFSSTPISFTNLILIARYTASRAIYCQLKPSGTHVRESCLAYWRLGDVILDGTWLKAVARFTGTEGSAPEPDRIEAKWEINGMKNLITSGINIQKFDSVRNTDYKDTENENPFSDKDLTSSDKVTKQLGVDWKTIETVKRLVSGKYSLK